MKLIRKKIYNIIEDSDEKISEVYNVFMMIVIVISIVPLCFRTQTTFLIIIDRITVSIFIIDYILRWLTYDFKKSELPKKAFLYYPFSFYAIIDLLSILPSLSIINGGFRLLKIFRLFKTFKVFRLLRYSKSFKIITSVLQKERIALTSVGCMAIGYIFVSALVMFSVEPNSFKTFFDSIYWATTALTTVGYGDIYPITVTGKIVSMVSSVLGIAFVALPSGIITAGYLSEINKEGE